ncbi:amidase domain-containing protein [Kitasatospora sp. YST-16]|uniref:amidase domain-containing protein n=1 Tax=Kitasatospora sp. YST-16 TaxID=2998080 RepID=UPI0022844482|nr:amidase domain-containing protein [Kitasatospora sp. YST-16]WAL71133.1 amidase domain-containing protein [Kitasatospora sp. YST-16]WNW37170.1 amidase domain-containing protein [Streptomyces sp. Li-HN-5-13]
MDLDALAAANSIALDSAANGWLTLSRESWKAVNDIHANGVDPLKENWKDKVGASAGQKLEEQARILETGADLTRAVAMILDGLGSNVARAKITMNAALDMANQYGLTVDRATGLVHNGSGTPDSSTDNAVQEINAMLREALREAAQADAQAAAELRKLGAATCETDPQRALDDYQGEASRIEINMYSGSIPDGSDPRLVTDWWNALPESQHQQLMRSDPVTLANLPGIPDSVKLELHGGPNAKYDPVKTVQWALEHWDDTSVDRFDDNCTNFASEALHQGGLHAKGDSLWGWRGDDTWGRSDDSGKDWLSQRLDYSKSWAGAQNMHDFMVHHGGQELSPDQVRPGDIVYYEEESDQDGETGKNVIHHTAVVTAVTPTGDIKYTQHSGGQQNASVDGRIDAFQEHRGQQKLHFVRVSPDWY